MSFPFYNRSTKEKGALSHLDKRQNSHSQSSNCKEAQSPRHSRTSSKMHIPFLGKRRKSIATLRSSSLSGAIDDNTSDNQRNAGHYKTVSQLADETAARMAGRSSLGPAGSLSTWNLELPSLSTSPLKLGSAYSSPTKERSPHSRHTMFSSMSSLHATPTKPQPAEKSKPSFLARITSRPSLSARYSSADLKSSVKSKQEHRPIGKAEAIRYQDIMHGVPVLRARDVADDKNIFTSPRTAPSPPNLQFASPSTFSQGSLLAPPGSLAVAPSSRQSLLLSHPGNTTIYRRQSAQPLTTPMKASTQSPRHIKPDTATLSPTHAKPSSSPGHRPKPISPVLPPIITSLPYNSGEPITPAQPRPGLVRIGNEKVTLSVANVLEAELGVDIHDSEDESIYDDSYGSQYSDDKQAFKSGLATSKLSDFQFDPSSDLPPLSASSDEFFNLISKYPPPAQHIEVDSKSPLSVLINASTEDGSTSAGNDVQHLNRHPYSGQRQSLSETSLKTFTFPSNNNDRPHVPHVLDRISEKSVVIDEELQENKKSQSKDESTQTSTPTIGQLEQSLKVQCARFDRLAAHLLSIIQRHQNEKLQYENQISSLEKGSRRQEREIKGLRWLLMRNNKASADKESEVPRGPVRKASMQSFFSVAASDDGEVDLEYAVKLLSRAGRRESSHAVDDETKETRTSIDLSPTLMPKRPVKADLRRTRTMPDLHKPVESTGNGLLSEHSLTSPPLPLPTPSPDVSGLGLGLDFPLPEPLVLPSISDAILSSAPSSASSVPALTAAPTAASGLSIASEYSTHDNGPPPDGPPPPTPVSSTRRNEGRGGLSSREKRMAREWRPGPSPTKGYSPVEDLSGGASPASTAYANNLNKTLSPSINSIMKSDGSVKTVDLDAIYQRLIERTNDATVE